jgi:hypothetical protein
MTDGSACSNRFVFRSEFFTVAVRYMIHQQVFISKKYNLTGSAFVGLLKVVKHGMPL